MLADATPIKQEKVDPVVKQCTDKLTEMRKMKVQLAKKYDKLKEFQSDKEKERENRQTQKNKTKMVTQDVLATTTKDTTAPENMAGVPCTIKKSKKI